MFNFKDNDLSVTIAIVLSIAWPSVILYLAITSNAPFNASAAAGSNDSVAERIRPVVTLDDILGPGDQQSVAVVAEAKTPETLYQGACLACHAAGVANAPKLGDKAAWESKAATGIDNLLQSVINGKGAMPPKGGSAYSDEELRSVIEYMLAESGL